MPLRNALFPGNMSFHDVSLRPGSHSIVGKKRNFLTLSETLVLLPGKEEVFEAKLVSLDEATVKVRR